MSRRLDHAVNVASVGPALVGCLHLGCHWSFLLHVCNYAGLRGEVRPEFSPSATTMFSSVSNYSISKNNEQRDKGCCVNSACYLSLSCKPNTTGEQQRPVKFAHDRALQTDRCGLVGLFRSRALEIEIPTLRHQLNILRRSRRSNDPGSTTDGIAGLYGLP